MFKGAAKKIPSTERELLQVLITVYNPSDVKALFI